MSHVRANLWLLLLTVALCTVLYPLVLLGVGQAFFADKANGSLVAGRGSRLIARPMVGDEYLQPRPSAVDYNALASGGSNLAASNPALRDRVARQLGPIVRYAGGPKAGQRVGPDVAAWAAAQGLKADGDPQAVHFDAWMKAHPDAALEKVPADMVTTSGSGLDPHITLTNALYQVETRVAAARAGGGNVAKVRQGIEALLRQQAFRPLGGLAGGEPLVNVLEANLRLDETFPKPK